MSNSIRNLEDLQNKVWSSDLYIRQEAGSELLTVLSDGVDDVFDCGFQWDSMCNGLVRWISGTNFKISLVALKAIGMIATRMGEELAPTLTSMLPAIIDRLGDSKEMVRKESASLLQVLMSHVKSPKEILDDMVPKVMAHKNAKVREGLLLCLSETLLNFGHKELSLSKIMPSILELASDSNSLVRDQAIETLCDIYKLIGEPVRVDIKKRRSLPLQKEKMIEQRFDELLRQGQVTQTSSSSSRSSSRAPSVESLNEDVGGGGRLAKSTSSGTLNKRTMPLKKSSSSHKRGGLGGVDSELLCEENLDAAIAEYPTVSVSSSRELAEFCNNIGNILENSGDWEKRIEALKDLRGLLFAGVDHFKEFKPSINGLSRALDKALRDLRSQVVREACITVSAMSTEMKNNFGTLAEKLLTPLFSQLLINVKVMNVSAHVCCRRIISCTQYSKMIVVICESATKSKSAMCRRKCAEYIELIFQVWELNIITKNLSNLELAIKTGVNDADSETRTWARQTFWLYHEHFTKNAENMMKTFDTSKQKMLRETKLGKGGATPGAGSSSTLRRTAKKTSAVGPGSSATLPKPPTMSKSTPDLSMLGKTSTLPRQAKTPSRTPGGPRSTAASPANDRSATSTKARSGSGSAGVRRSVSARSVNSMVSNESRSATLRRANRGSPGRASPAGSRTAQSPRSSAIRKSASANLNQDSLASAFGRGTIPRMTSQDSIASSTDSSNHEVRDIHEILRAIESASWKIREEGVAKLKARINEERGFNARERKVVLQLFESLLNDNHARILGLTLDVLDEFLALYRTNLTDWGSTILAKALYLQSMKQTASNFDRVLRLLDTLHRSFPYDLQLTWCFTILDSRQVHGNAKMKGTLLEYMSCTFDVMDPMEFIQTKESTIGLRVLLNSTTDPKAPDIRKSSQCLIATMFRHSPPVFSSILNTLSEEEQGQCVVLLQETVPTMMSQEAEVLQGYPGYVFRKKPSSPSDSTHASEDSTSLFDAINQRFGSSPGSYTSYDVDAENINPDTVVPHKDASFEPKITPNKLNNSRNNHSFQPNQQIEIDRSITAEVQVASNNSINGATAVVSNTSLNSQHAVISNTSLNGEMEEDNVFRVLEALLGGTAQEKSGALVETINLLKEELINEENSYDFLSAILCCLEDDDGDLVSKSLKVLNKFLVYQPEYMSKHCEEVVTKMIKAKCTLNPPDTEQLYQLLVMLYKPDAILSLLMPMLQNESYPILLSVINLLYTTLKLNNADTQPLLETRLAELTVAVCPQCSHVETNVRKQSIFCLVELLLVFGTDKIDPLLESLTVSQKKLVYLYYNRHQRNSR